MQPARNTNFETTLFATINSVTEIQAQTRVGEIASEILAVIELCLALGLVYLKT